MDFIQKIEEKQLLDNLGTYSDFAKEDFFMLDKPSELNRRFLNESNHHLYRYQFAIVGQQIQQQVSSSKDAIEFKNKFKKLFKAIKDGVIYSEEILGLRQKTIVYKNLKTKRFLNIKGITWQSNKNIEKFKNQAVISDVQEKEQKLQMFYYIGVLLIGVAVVILILMVYMLRKKSPAA